MSFRGQYAIPAGRLKVSNRELARGATGIVFPGRLKPAGLGPSERVSYKVNRHPSIGRMVSL